LLAVKNHPPPTTAEKPGKRDYLSYSAVSLFQSCPLRYFFRYILGLPEKIISSSLVLGACIHASVQFHFEQLLSGRPAPDLDALLDVYQHTWQTYQGRTIQFPKGENRDSLGRLADRMLRSFRQSTFAHPEGTILGIEEELKGVLVPGLPRLLGRLDLAVDTPDELVITDFKTTKSAWNQSHVEEAAPQLLLYSELAKPLANGKRIRLAFAILTKARFPELTLHPVALDPHQIERTKKVVERVWRAIQSGHFYPNPSPINCPGCPYREPCQKWKG
jgi:CRISPR/Cas system-associated exonuclease Cas4 (RecB family)